MLTGIVPGRLKTVVGDASLPEAGGHRIILSIVSDNGTWDDKFLQVLSTRWPIVKSEYKIGYLSQINCKVGNIQEINVRSDLTVVNAIAKQNLEVKYDALKECLCKVAALAKSNNSSVHCTMLENWEKINILLVDEIINKGINVTVYENIK